MSNWIPMDEQTPEGEVLLAGPTYNDPSTGVFWRRVGFYHNGTLYADDEYDPREGYPPTHWHQMPDDPTPLDPQPR